MVFSEIATRRRNQLSEGEGWAAFAGQLARAWKRMAAENPLTVQGFRRVLLEQGQAGRRAGRGENDSRPSGSSPTPPAWAPSAPWLNRSRSQRVNCLRKRLHKASPAFLSAASGGGCRGVPVEQPLSPTCCWKSVGPKKMDGEQGNGVRSNSPCFDPDLAPSGHSHFVHAFTPQAMESWKGLFRPTAYQEAKQAGRRSS